jgi:hypothetical protein
MNEHTFFARLNECLDDRRDPLDDAELAAFLDAHPEHLDALAALRADLLALGRASRTTARRRRWSWLAAAAVAAAAAFAVAVWPRAPHPPCTPCSPRILAASLEELRPRTYISADLRMQQRLLRTATTTFETWEYRSEPR